MAHAMRRTGSEHGWLIWVVVIAALGTGGVLLWRMRDDVPQIVAQVLEQDAGVAYDAGVAEVDAGVAAIAPKPPIQGDDLLRKLASAGSKSNDLAGWLSAPDIVQRIAAASRLIADGKSPRPVLMFVELEGDFSVFEQGGKIFMAPESYRRYDGLVRAFTSLEPAYAARAYSDLRPYFDSAFSQVARKGERFDDVLAAAVLRITSVKFPEGPIELAEKGAIYTFADPSLESLSAVEKHVIRMGPQNVEALQKWLRTFAESVGLRLAR
jgi:hypothetical protein